MQKIVQMIVGFITIAIMFKAYSALFISDATEQMINDTCAAAYTARGAASDKALAACECMTDEAGFSSGAITGQMQIGGPSAEVEKACLKEQGIVLPARSNVQESLQRAQQTREEQKSIRAMERGAQRDAMQESLNNEGYWGRD
jgi:hypothetical protein